MSTIIPPTYSSVKANNVSSTESGVSITRISSPVFRQETLPIKETALKRLEQLKHALDSDETLDNQEKHNISAYCRLHGVPNDVRDVLLKLAPVIPAVIEAMPFGRSNTYQQGEQPDSVNHMQMIMKIINLELIGRILRKEMPKTEGIDYLTQTNAQSTAIALMGGVGNCGERTNAVVSILADKVAALKQGKALSSSIDPETIKIYKYAYRDPDNGFIDHVFPVIAIGDYKFAFESWGDDYQLVMLDKHMFSQFPIKHLGEVAKEKGEGLVTQEILNETNYFYATPPKSEGFYADLIKQAINSVTKPLLKEAIQGINVHDEEFCQNFYNIDKEEFTEDRLPSGQVELLAENADRSYRTLRRTPSHKSIQSAKENETFITEKQILDMIRNSDNQALKEFLKNKSIL